VSKPTVSIGLAGYDDIFNVGADGVQIQEIPLAELFPPEFHPFQVNNDDAMQQLAQSVKQYGVREPGLARPRADGGYELLAGNRRKMACEIAGIPTLPVIVRELCDDDAAIAMVDSNLQQREKLLFSEKAWAYKVKMDALNHKGAKSEDGHSVDVLAAQTGENKSFIFRLIRLTDLIIGLLDKVDVRELSFTAAVELSYLTVPEQTSVADAMTQNDVKPSHSQAVRLKKMKQAGTLTTEEIYRILAEDKKPPKGTPAGSARYRRFFPIGYSPKQIDAVIVELLTDWKARATV
jgi:ParB family chromosome partitioning protein